MSRRHTRLEEASGYHILTLARPDTRNTITDPEMLDELIGTIDDPEIDVLIITGEGTAFSAGGDVKGMAERKGMFAGTPFQISEAYIATIQRLTRTLAATDTVTIAAVNGPAVGAGFDLVLGCDLRIGSTRAWFAHTFIDLGIIPGDGGAWLLPRVVGWQRATELALTARRVGSTEAVGLDILLEEVEPDQLIPKASTLAAEIASKPRHSVRATKRLLRHARDMGLDGFLDLSASLQAISHEEPAHREALDRYLSEWESRKAGRGGSAPLGDEGARRE